MGSSQPRVAKVENRDPEVSLDLQMKAIFAASPDARRDFHGLIKKWSRGPQRSQPALVATAKCAAAGDVGSDGPTPRDAVGCTVLRCASGPLA
jgi:hypothetical protein